METNIKKSYYQILEIDSTADQMEIKHAYFRLVKRFTPEKEPEQFKQLREAYEELSDPAKRKKYDNLIAGFDTLPEEVAQIANSSVMLLQVGKSADAIELLLAAKKRFPDQPQLMFELSNAYMAAGNSGKAYNILNELLKAEPDNPKYLSATARCCSARGWDLKAIDFAQRATVICPSDEESWILYAIYKTKDLPGFFGYKIFVQGLEAVEAADKKAPMLCLFAFQCLLRISTIDQQFLNRESMFGDSNISLKGLNNSPQSLDECLKRLLKHSEAGAVSTIRDSFETMHDQLEIILHILHANNYYSMFENIREVIKNLGYEQFFQSEVYKLLELGSNAVSASDNGIDKVLCKLALCNAELSSKNTDVEHKSDWRDELLLTETEALVSFDTLRPGILRFKQEYPRLYIHCAEFLDTVLRMNSTRIQSLMEQRITKVKKIIDSRPNGYDWDFLGEDDDFDQDFVQQPIRVEKIGRNDPCPCGSGKKYKKCCGR
jgi:tetratricopeptide (TPR) repeat protein